MPQQVATGKIVHEPAREIMVCREVDVVVVGGGPAGVGGPAVAAARTGANTVLLERNGHLGGMITGGLGVLRKPFVLGLASGRTMAPGGGATKINIRCKRAR